MSSSDGLSVCVYVVGIGLDGDDDDDDNDGTFRCPLVDPTILTREQTRNLCRCVLTLNLFLFIFGGFW